MVNLMEKYLVNYLDYLSDYWLENLMVHLLDELVR